MTAAITRTKDQKLGGMANDPLTGLPRLPTLAEVVRPEGVDPMTGLPSLSNPGASSSSQDPVQARWEADPFKINRVVDHLRKLNDVGYKPDLIGPAYNRALAMEYQSSVWPRDDKGEAFLDMFDPKTPGSPWLHMDRLPEEKGLLEEFGAAGGRTLAWMGRGVTAAATKLDPGTNIVSGITGVDVGAIMRDRANRLYEDAVGSKSLRPSDDVANGIDFSNPRWWASFIGGTATQLTAQTLAAVATGGSSVVFAATSAIPIAGNRFMDSMKELGEQTDFSPELKNAIATSDAVVAGLTDFITNKIFGAGHAIEGPSKAVITKSVGQYLLQKAANRGIAGAREAAQELIQGSADDVLLALSQYITGRDVNSLDDFLKKRIADVVGGGLAGSLITPSGRFVENIGPDPQVDASQSSPRVRPQTPLENIDAPQTQAQAQTSPEAQAQPVPEAVNTVGATIDSRAVEVPGRTTQDMLPQQPADTTGGTALEAQRDVGVRPQPVQGVEAEAGPREVPTQKFTKVQLKKMVQDEFPELLIGTGTRKTFDTGGMSEAQRVQSQSELLEIEDPSRDYARYLGKVFVLDKQGKIHRISEGPLVGVKASDLNVGDTFEVDNHTGRITDKYEGGLTFELIDNNLLKYDRPGTETLGDVYNVPLDKVLPINSVETSNALQEQEAGTVHEDVRTQPIEGQGQVPAQESPQRVQEGQQEEVGPLANVDRHAAGFVDISPLVDAVEAAAKSSPGKAAIGGAVSIPKKALDYWSEPLLDKVERSAGKVGAKVANLGRLSIDESNRVTGSLEPILKPYLRSASGESVRSRKAVNKLNAIEWAEGGDWGVTKFRRAVEGQIPESELTPAELNIVQRYRTLITETGAVAEDAGLKIKNQEGQWVDFQASKEGKRLIRRSTPELMDILRSGDSPEYRALAKVLAKANGIDEDLSLRHLNQLRHHVGTKRAAFESMRAFEVFPSIARLNGREIPLLIDDPFAAGESLVRSTAMRVGFTKQFGQDLDGTGMQSLIDGYVRSGGREKDISNLMLALQGIPLDVPILAKPGTPEYEAARYGRAAAGFVSTLALSRSAIPNIPESLGNTLAFTGIKPWLRAWYQIACNPSVAAKLTAEMGARTVNVMNLGLTPHRRLESLTRIFRDVGLRLTGNVPMNELNELHAAVAGVEFAKDLKNGVWKDTPEVAEVRLKLRKFTDQEAAQLIDGTASDDLYNAVVTRTAEATQGSTSLPAQISRKANNRLLSSVIRYDSYAQMKMNRTARVTKELYDAIASGDKKKILAASRVAAVYHFGTTASGMSAWMLRALAVGGLVGLSSAFEEAKDDKLKFALGSWWYAAIGGPAEQIVRASTANTAEEAARQLMRSTLPTNELMEAFDFFRGQGRYRDRSTLEKVQQLLDSHVPLTDVVVNGFAALGLSDQDPGLDAAISAYWRYRRDEAPLPGKFTSTNASEEHKEFRIHLRRAVEAMKSGDDPVEHFKAALGVEGKGRKNIKQSLRGRLLLKKLNQDQRDRLKKRIGQQAYEKLESYDAMIESWIRRT